MSKYIKREDADKTLCDLVREYNREARGLESSGAFEALSRIRLVPNADVAPVKRGRWKKVRIAELLVVFACSACGWQTSDYGRYCPNCGAKMDGDGDV